MANVKEMEKVLKALQETAKCVVTPNVEAWLKKSQNPVTSEEDFVTLVREFMEAMKTDGIW